MSQVQTGLVLYNFMFHSFGHQTLCVVKGRDIFIAFLNSMVLQNSITRLGIFCHCSLSLSVSIGLPYVK